MATPPGREYWREPTDRPLTRAYWEDPLPEWQGMLSSDLIAYYDDQIGGMIGPWTDAQLKPAGYELTLGEMCLVQGERKILTPDDPWVEIPPNSIVFVSMEQWVRLPHYIAARFDLAIEFIYQGILLGTGPHVDPGFQGVLSCPLHNISNDAVHMRLSRTFAKMDFAKTSGLWEKAEGGWFTDISDEQQLYEREAAGALVGMGGKPARLFKDGKRWRQPILDEDYAGPKRVKSSVKDIADDVALNREEVREFGGDIRRLRRFGLASALAVVLAIAGLLITLAQLDRSYTDAKISSNQQPAFLVVSRLRRNLEQSNRQVGTLRQDVDSLRREVKALQRRGR
jgi:deoxycytidine triphosphate deaminase